MQELSERERELVIIGAAIASNCIPCIEKHIPLAKTAGLSRTEIDAAIRLAELVRQKPAGKVVGAAQRILGDGDAGQPAGTQCAVEQCACC